jgi:hypothetical protein
MIRYVSNCEAVDGFCQWLFVNRIDEDGDVQCAPLRSMPVPMRKPTLCGIALARQLVAISNMRESTTPRPKTSRDGDWLAISDGVQDPGGYVVFGLFPRYWPYYGRTK